MRASQEGSREDHWVTHDKCVMGRKAEKVKSDELNAKKSGSGDEEEYG